ncbi:MAG: PTS sugar transporter subunit IIA [Gammaproteobacteria bacterium]|nr:PTS sugar transporter subunit IIA [Gammaproteobacteria bacterium]
MSMPSRSVAGSLPFDGSPRPMDYLDPAHVVVDLDVSSRKRLFEEIARVVTENGSGTEIQAMLPLTPERVFETLHERERLGSTGIGKGIGLPHGRLKNLSEPIIAMVRLESPIEYAAPDCEPVWFIVCLLVPEDANEVHLNLLAELAKRLDDSGFVSLIREAKTSDEIMQLFSGA